MWPHHFVLNPSELIQMRCRLSDTKIIQLSEFSGRPTSSSNDASWHENKIDTPCWWTCCRFTAVSLNWAFLIIYYLMKICQKTVGTKKLCMRFSGALHTTIKWEARLWSCIWIIPRQRCCWFARKHFNQVSFVIILKSMNEMMIPSLCWLNSTRRLDTTWW